MTITHVSVAPYLGDPAAYANFLSETQRVRFDEWRENGARDRGANADPAHRAFDDGHEPDWFPE